MSEVFATNKNNVINFPTLDIAPFTKIGDDLVMIIGSNNVNAEKAFEKCVLGDIDVTVRGLRIKAADAILTGYDFNDVELKDELSRKLQGLNPGAKFWVPADYDYEKQVAFKNQGDLYLKYHEPDAITNLKYQVSRLGNPKYYIVFKIGNSAYKNSDFYNNVIKPKHQS